MAMLSLVSGPTDIVPADALDAVAAPLLLQTNAAIWVDGLGLVASAEYVADVRMWPTYLVQLDGRAVQIGGAAASTGFGWSIADSLPVMSFTSSWQKMRLPSRALLSVEYGKFISVGAPGIMPDRVLAMLGTGVHSAPYDSGDDVTEFTFPDLFLSGYPHLAYAGQVDGTHLWWVIDSAGTVVQYDATNRREGPAPRTSLGSAVRLSAYSVKLGLFFAVRRDTGRTPNVDQLYVYANEPVADSIASPSFSPSPERGGASTLTTRVLGDLGEPCAGRHVTFAVDSGTLENAVVTTDAGGYAKTRWCGPTDGAPSGRTATATLVE